MSGVVAKVAGGVADTDRYHDASRGQRAASLRATTPLEAAIPRKDPVTSRELEGFVESPVQYSAVASPARTHNDDDASGSKNSSHEDEGVSNYNADGNENDSTGSSSSADDDNKSAVSDTEMTPDLRRHVFLLKCIYFFMALSGSTWGRFGTVYYYEKGLSNYEIGILEGCIPAVQVFALPFWGIVADKIRSRKRVALFTSFVSASILMLLAFPSIARNYASILTITLAMSLFVSGGVLDAHTLDVLGKKHMREYGRIRMWSSIAWGVGALVMGFVTDEVGFGLNFVLYGCFAVGNILILYKVIPERTQTEAAVRPAGVRLSDLGLALVRPRMLFFLIEIALFGAGMSVVERLLFIYIREDLNGNTVLCGLTVLITVIFELPIFWYAQLLLKKLGHHGMFCVAMFAHTVRVFGYTLLTEDSRYWILCLEVMHGVTFACMWSAAVEYAREGLPKEWASSAQSILVAALSCVGGGTGAIVGGWVMEHHGARYMYRGAGFIASGALVIHVTYMLVHGAGADAMKKLNKEHDDEEGEDVGGDRLSSGGGEGADGGGDDEDEAVASMGGTKRLYAGPLSNSSSSPSPSSSSSSLSSSSAGEAKMAGDGDGDDADVTLDGLSAPRTLRTTGPMSTSAATWSGHPSSARPSAERTRGIDAKTKGGQTAALEGTDINSLTARSSNGNDKHVP